MGDGHDRARVVVQEALEPGDRLGVEVVGRLVEQQHVGPLQQQPAQRHAAPLAAREVTHFGVARREAQRVHRDLELAVELPRVHRVDPVLQLRLLLEQRVHRVVVHRLGELRRDRLELGEQRARLGDALVHDVEHGLGLVELRLLRQEADAQPLVRPRDADELLVDAGHDLEQRALARAVVTEHADLRAGIERQRDPVEQDAVRRDDLAQVLHDEDELGQRRTPWRQRPAGAAGPRIITRPALRRAAAPRARAESSGPPSSGRESATRRNQRCRSYCSVKPMPPCTSVALRRISLADLRRDAPCTAPPGARPAPARGRTRARRTSASERAGSSAAAISASMCFTAWNEPITRPNCLRCAA